MTKNCVFEFESNLNEISLTSINDYRRYGDIFDMAHAFLAISSMTHKKLQKLCYYAMRLREL